MHDCQICESNLASSWGVTRVMELDSMSRGQAGLNPIALHSDWKWQSSDWWTRHYSPRQNAS